MSAIPAQGAPVRVDLTNAQRQELNAFFRVFAGDNYAGVTLGDYDVADGTQSIGVALRFFVYYVLRGEVNRGIFSPPDTGSVIRGDRGGAHFDFVTATYIESLLLKFFGITGVQHGHIYFGEWRAIEFRNGRYYHVSVNGGPWTEIELNVIDFYDNGNGTFSAGIEIEIREFDEGELIDQSQHFNAAIVRPFGDTWQLLYWRNDADRNAPLPGQQAPPPPPAPATATPSTHSILVDGQPVAFRAFTIGGSNFFMLRDLAYTLNGTASQFEVTWDGSRNAINLITGSPYTPVGGEMPAGDNAVRDAHPSTAAVYVDGQPVNLRAYTIGGNNFFMLRDLGEALGFGVDWDAAAGTVLITTD